MMKKCVGSLYEIKELIYVSGMKFMKVIRSMTRANISLPSIVRELMMIVDPRCLAALINLPNLSRVAVSMPKQKLTVACSRGQQSHLNRGLNVLCKAKPMNKWTMIEQKLSQSEIRKIRPKFFQLLSRNILHCKKVCIFGFEK